MSQVLQKASFSPIIYDMVDYSNAIFDPDGELIGQTANCPVHIAAMHFSAAASLQRFPVAELEPGDIVILNDPYHGRHAHARRDNDNADVLRRRAAGDRGQPRALDRRRRQPRHPHRRRGPAAASADAVQRRQAQRRARRDHQELHAHAAVRRGRHPGADRSPARRARRDGAAGGQVRRGRGQGGNARGARLHAADDRRRDRADPRRRLRGQRLRRQRRVLRRPGVRASEARRARRPDHGRPERERSGDGRADQLAVRQHSVGDLLLAEVLPEPGRAAQRGLVSPDRPRHPPRGRG